MTFHQSITPNTHEFKMQTGQERVQRRKRQPRVERARLWKASTIRTWTRIYSDYGNTCNSDSDSLAIKSEPYKYDISAIREQYMTTSPRSSKIPFEAFFAEDVCKLSKEWGVVRGIDRDNYGNVINNVCRCRSDLYPNEDRVCSDKDRAKCKVAYSSF